MRMVGKGMIIYTAVTNINKVKMDMHIPWYLVNAVILIILF